MSCFECRVSGFRFRVSGFRFRVSGLELQLLGSGFMVYIKYVPGFDLVSLPHTIVEHLDCRPSLLENALDGRVVNRPGLRAQPREGAHHRETPHLRFWILGFGLEISVSVLKVVGGLVLRV